MLARFLCNSSAFNPVVFLIVFALPFKRLPPENADEKGYKPSSSPCVTQFLSIPATEARSLVQLL